jgi:hypothetical protein
MLSRVAVRDYTNQRGETVAVATDNNGMSWRPTVSDGLIVSCEKQRERRTLIML